MVVYYGEFLVCLGKFLMRWVMWWEDKSRELGLVFSMLFRVYEIDIIVGEYIFYLWIYLV